VAELVVGQALRERRAAARERLLVAVGPLLRHAAAPGLLGGQAPNLEGPVETIGLRGGPLRSRERQAEGVDCPGEAAQAGDAREEAPAVQAIVGRRLAHDCVSSQACRPPTVGPPGDVLPGPGAGSKGLLMQQEVHFFGARSGDDDRKVRRPIQVEVQKSGVARTNGRRETLLARECAVSRPSEP